MEKTSEYQNLLNFLYQVPIGLAQINNDGFIKQFNATGAQFMMPLIESNNLDTENFFTMLEVINESLVKKIRDGITQKVRKIITNEIYTFEIVVKDRVEVKHFSFSVIYIDDASILVSFNDVSERQEREIQFRQVLQDKAIEQGKFEVASGILHDIGNAVVGFGSYINKTKRFIDQNDSKNLKKLSVFFVQQLPSFEQAIGTVKAGALVKLLDGIEKNYENTIQELKIAISDQVAIISHIQDILNIQRQYISGQENFEWGAVNMKVLINDCLAMQAASLQKRKISVKMDMFNLPVIVKGDRTKLMQVVLNIIKNAYEAIESYENSNREMIIKLQEDDENWILLFSDSGVGFKSDDANKFFTKGYTLKSNGTGLGLYNSRNIMQTHHGDMKIYSEGIGLGAVVTLIFAKK